MATVIKWNKKAVRHFDNAIKYIEQDSVTNATNVAESLLKKISGLIKHPEKYTLDKYKLENDGSYRAFELYHYRISYRFKKNEIRIIRIRHTKMNPLLY